jgi:fibro-slime domain-containing protein
VEVNVTAKAGLIPENTVLQVLSIEKEHEAYSEIEKKLQEKASGEDYEIAGFLAYDISFIDKDGNKIEPSGEVTVTIDYKKAAVPKDVSTNENTNITVMHLEEDSRGEVAQVVDMEQSEQLVNLEVNKEQAVEKVEFKTESFSTFTIAWIRTTTDTPINAHYGYLADGKWVEFDTKIVMTSKEMKDGEEEDFYNYKLGNSDRFTENGKKYKFNSLRLYNSRAAEFRYLKISVLNQGWGTQCKFSYSMNGTTYNSTDVQSELEIYYVYEEIETDSEIPKETESETQVETETKSPVSGGSNQSAESKELTEVTTVDSKSLGITMRMINYDNKLIKDDRSWFLRSEVQSKYGLYNEFDAKTFNGAYDGKVQQGLVEKVLKDGYPAVVKNNTNNSWNSQYPTLKGLFAENTTDGDVKDVNHLFIQSTYDNTGYLEYSSFENYAYLEESGDFTVYNQIGTQSDGTGYDSNRGNFMPYNKIEAGKIAKTSKNLYDEHGNSLKSTANQEGSRYNEDLYLTQGENDYFFGLYMEANFMQPENGRVTHKGTTQNMIYEFNGDDDLWVYIDNVLVLDIGGVHSAHSGKIDFATGEVEVEIYYPTTSGVTEARKQQTNIRQLFKAAGILPNGDAWNEKEANQYFIGNTFKDYTNHTFKMFYMERGAGASNLHMSFNLQVLPDVEITKEFVDENGNKVEASDSNEEFSFLVELKRGTNSTIGNYEGNYYLKNSEGKYCYYDTNGELQTSFEKKYYGTTTNGMIKLKVGYTIVIENVPAGTEFRVSEKELNKNIYDTPNTSGEHCIVTSNENGVIAGRTLKNETAKVVITNRLRKIEIYQLPSSGGPGTYLFTISGVAILMTAILMAIQSRKRTVK